MRIRVPGISAIVAAAGLAACATTGTPQMGAQPDSVPPKLVATDAKDPVDGHALYDWDRPSAFGAVAGDRKAMGDAACMAARPDLEALGYHPAALDQNGKPLPGGGYYCYRKANGDVPDAVPPRLVAKASDAGAPATTVWDRPMAFGRVPDALQAKGDAACMRSGISLQAIGYHPAALDSNGKPLPDGGYFCFRKANGDAPASMAPKLVRVNGILGWDKPAYFGAVPPDQQARGDAICARNGMGQRAIGFHARATDERGAPISGGGFFCANLGVVAKT